jgi:hypothetical protein
VAGIEPLARAEVDEGVAGDEPAGEIDRQGDREQAERDAHEGDRKQALPRDGVHRAGCYSA